MDARTGKKIRMGRLFDWNSHKTLIVAYSHGVLMGPRPGMRSLEEMKQMVLRLGRANGLMVAPGLVTPLEEAFIGRDRPSLFVHMDYQSFSRDIMPYPQGSAVEMARIEDVIAAGADGVMTYLYMGYDDPEREKMEIARNARLARDCEKWGILLMIEPRSAREAGMPSDKTDPNILSLYCRVSAEIGADLVKCIHPGEEQALRRELEVDRSLGQDTVLELERARVPREQVGEDALDLVARGLVQLALAHEPALGEDLRERVARIDAEQPLQHADRRVLLPRVLVDVGQLDVERLGVRLGGDLLLEGGHLRGDVRRGRSVGRRCRRGGVMWRSGARGQGWNARGARWCGDGRHGRRRRSLGRRRGGLLRLRLRFLSERQRRHLDRRLVHRGAAGGALRHVGRVHLLAAGARDEVHDGLPSAPGAWSPCGSLRRAAPCSRRMVQDPPPNRMCRAPLTVPRACG